MANVDIKLGYKNTAWFTTNAAIILKIGQIVYLEQTGTYKIGDGVTALSALSFLGNNDLSNLIRQELNYTTGSQTFTLTESASAVYSVFRNGQELRSSEYNVSATMLTIITSLDSGDNIDIIYSSTTVGVNPSYTKLEVDDLLAQVDANALLYAMSF